MTLMNITITGAHTRIRKHNFIPQQSQPDLIKPDFNTKTIHNRTAHRIEHTL